MNISKNFTMMEFSCKHCSKCINISFKLLIGLEKLRTLLDRPIHINSGYRCKKHPLERHKTKIGKHTLGFAADIKLPSGMSMKQFHDAVLQIKEFTGIGIPVNSNYIHVDVRSKPAKWAYDHNQKQVTYNEGLEILGWIV